MPAGHAPLVAADGRLHKSLRSLTMSAAERAEIEALEEEEGLTAEAEGWRET